MNPRSSAQYIADNSKHVTICKDGVQALACKLLEFAKSKDLSGRWKEHELNPKDANDKAVDWIFMIDVLNFSFWSSNNKEKYVVKYGSQTWSGYWSCCAAVNRALDEGIPITDPKYYSSITEEQLKHVFRSDSEHPIPLLQERLQCLHEVGTVLNKKYNGSFVNCIKECKQSAVNLLELIVREFPCFRDEADFLGKKVSIYKRAQIVIADIWSCFNGQGLGTFHDIDCMTMFADYRIPQVLVYFDVLKYSNDLMDKLKEGHMFESGDQQEVELRGCSIWAIELVNEEIQKLLQKEEQESVRSMKVNSVIIDHYLWDYRREHVKETDHIPFHRTRSVYY